MDNVSFDIYRGETFGLVGESGSGKTTIGRAIIRINKVSAGDILYEGKRISGKIDRECDREVIRNIQMIFQDPMASLNERAKVDYIISEGLMSVNHGMSAAERKEKVEQALLDVGLLPEFASRFPHEFSGGQRQRIGIARCLVMNPSFIIADEPISALDVSIRAQVLNLLSRLQQERGLTYLFIAHDLSVMRFITNRIAVIYKGVIVELAETEELFPASAASLYKGAPFRSAGAQSPCGTEKEGAGIRSRLPSLFRWRETRLGRGCPGPFCARQRTGT